MDYCTNTTPYIEETYPDHYNWDDGEWITISAGTPILENYDMYLEQGGSISGQIFESDGTTPITANQTIIMLLDDDGNWLDEHWLGVSSSYSFVDVKPGSYVLFVIPQGYTHQYYPGVLDFVSAGRINVTSGSDEIADFSVIEGGSISGNIKDENGISVSNISVILDRPDSEIGIDTCTDENGNYTIFGLPLNGSYYIHAGHDICDESSPDRYVIEWWDNASNRDEATPINVTSSAPNQAGIDFVLTKVGSISGFVYDSAGNPIEGAQVVVETFDWNWINDSWTFSNGSYSVEDLAPGDYRVKVFADGYAHTVYDGHIAYPFDFNTANPVSVISGMDTSDINFNLDDGGTIEVTVYDTDGTTPLSGVPVDTNAGGFGHCTDESGVVYLENLPLNTEIFIQAGGSQWGGCSQLNRVFQYYDGTSDYNSKTPVVLSSAGELKNISFTLDKGGVISGTVNDSNNRSTL